MRTIYKYDITDLNMGRLEAPIVRVLSVGEQRGRICVWAEVDTKMKPEKWEFLPIPTGISLEDQDGKYVLDKHTFYGTVSLVGGALIFHVYGRNCEEKKQTIQPKKTTENKSYATKQQSKINLSLLGF
jgi:hypothetical protein